MNRNPGHEIVVCGVPFETEYEEEALKRLKEIGVTSIQIYTFWNQFEPRGRGEFDWSFYDREVELIKKAGLKYVPFLLMGPRYAAPEWWLNSPGHRGLYCLEHGKYNPVESIWNPHFREEIIRVLGAFAAHYRPMDVLESIQPGISGDYGESIMPVIGNWPGAYHTHAGYWCGGEDARQSFRHWVQARYDSISKLNEVWRSCYTGWDDVDPFLPHKAPSRTAYFDMLDWYRGSMTEYTEFWMDACRQSFPDLPIYMCTGGVESPEHASSFSAQARVCARYDGGLRLTNEGNKFYDNFFITAYTKSACDLYGAYLGLEPVGPMTDNGVVARIFGSAAYGNRQMFHYYNNLFHRGRPDPRPAARAVRDYQDLIQARPLPRSVAIFWPGYYTAWYGGIPDDLRDAVTFIRRTTNCLPVNEDMIMDGALQRHTLLIVPVAGFTRREVLLKIAEWVRKGGTILTSGLTRDLELEDVPAYNALFGIFPESEQAAGIATQTIPQRAVFPEFSRIGSFISPRAWMGLASDVEVLSSTQEGAGPRGTRMARVAATFMRRVGEGVAIYYDGPMTFEPDPEAVFPDPGVYKALLTDVLRRYARTTDLTPREGEIARAEIGGQLFALGEGEIVALPEPPRAFGEEV